MDKNKTITSWSWDGQSLHLTVESGNNIRTSCISSSELRSPEFDIYQLIDELKENFPDAEVQRKEVA